MTLDPWVLATIAAMAMATYLTRAGGYLLFKAVRPSPLFRNALTYIPGALFVSYVVPALAQGGLQQWAGSIATALILLTTRSLAAAILGGIATAWAVWSLA